MADTTDGLTEATTDHALLPGERIEVLAWFDRPSPVNRSCELGDQTIAGVAGPEAPPGRRCATLVPYGRVALVLSDQRLLVFGPEDDGDIAALAVAFGPEHLVDICFKRGVDAASVRLAFADGSEARLVAHDEAAGRDLAVVAATFCRGRARELTALACRQVRGAIG